MMKLLAVCNQGRNRSRTLAWLYRKDKRFHVKYCGLYNPEKPLTEELAGWADCMIVFEEAQREEIGKRLPGILWRRRIIDFCIPDMFAFRQPELVELLKLKMMEEFG